MKKVLTSIMCLCLGGCSIYTAKTIDGPSPGVNWSKQKVSPYPWVCIIPSTQTLQMTDVNFNAVADSIRYTISFKPFNKKFSGVRLALVDYSILPPSSSSTNKLMVKYGGETYSQSFIDLPERYQLKISFFEGTARPPQAASFEETITMPTSKAPPQEAIIMLSNEIMEDLKASSLRQIKVDIN